MNGRTIHAQPLTRAAFAPFGSVIDKSGVASRPMNSGRARRFHDLAEIHMEGENSLVVVGLVEAEPYQMPLTLSLVERHPLGAQVFLPLSAGNFLVVVCPDESGRPGRPLAFVTRPDQGVSYHAGTWHAVLTPIEARQEFAVIDRKGPGPNLEEHTFDQAWIIHLPERADQELPPTQRSGRI